MAAESLSPFRGPLDVSWRPDTGNHTIHTPTDQLTKLVEVGPLPNLPQDPLTPETTLAPSDPV